MRQSLHCVAIMNLLIAFYLLLKFAIIIVRLVGAELHLTFLSCAKSALSYRASQQSRHRVTFILSYGFFVVSTLAIAIMHLFIIKFSSFAAEVSLRQRHSVLVAILLLPHYCCRTPSRRRVNLLQILCFNSLHSLCYRWFIRS